MKKEYTRPQSELLSAAKELAARLSSEGVRQVQPAFVNGEREIFVWVTNENLYVDPIFKWGGVTYKVNLILM